MLSLSRRLTWLACGTLLSGSALAQAGRSVFGDPTALQYAPTRTYHVENYKVAATIAMQGGISGDETVTLRPLHAGLRHFALDSSQLVIDRVSLQTKQGTWIPLKFESIDPKLWITLDREYSPADTLNVRVVYHGNPEGRPFPDAGLSFIRPDASMPTRPLEVWSYGWPQNNHFWFPCWDYPNDKSTSEVILTVPEPLSVVSNGELIKETHAAGQATFDWVEHAPHSVYLVSIAVGPWKKVHQTYESKPVDYYVPPGTDDATALRSFGLTPDMIAFYAHLYGVDYPYEKYAQTADHGFGGGTENISATSLAESTLHDARAEQDYPSMDLVSHELAHQWFGDLITEWSWDDAWLSEGFATFSAALYRGHHDGNDAFRYLIYQDQQTAMREDTTRYRRPIVDRHYTKPWEMLDRTTYQKGAAVLDMLRYVIDDGVESTPSPDEPFFRVLRAYLTAYRAGNVDTQNLVDMIRKTTGQELGWFFDEWLMKGGYPQYAVSSTYDGSTRQAIVAIRQTQIVDSVTPLFDMPVHLVFHGANGERQESVIRVHSAGQSFPLSVPFQPLWTDFDPNGHIYSTVAVAEPLTALIARAQRDDSMMSRLWAAQQLAHVGDDQREAAVTALAAMLQQDAFYGVRIASAQSLGTLGGNSATRALSLALHQPSSQVRAASVEALGNMPANPEIFAALQDHLHTDDSYAVQAAAARQLGKLGTPQAEAALTEAASTAPSHYVMAGLLDGLSHFKDPQATAIIASQASTGSTDEIRTQAKRLLNQTQHGK